jgi:hypothetical protein
LGDNVVATVSRYGIAVLDSSIEVMGAVIASNEQMIADSSELARNVALEVLVE